MDPITAADIFGRSKALVGMVHVQALPGTPASRLGPERIAARAAEEARLLAGSGFDAILIENMHDAPYLRRRVGPEIVAAMTRVGSEVRAAVSVPLGVQILAGCNREALAVAHAVEARFIRAEGFVFASVADEGLLDEADAGPLLRYRRAIGAERIGVLADIKKKHSAHAITADLDIAEMARGAELFGADALVVTGTATGRPVRLDELHAVAAATRLPVVVGSGATPESAAELLAHAEALIVGSWCKEGGHWSAPPDPRRVREMARAVAAARG